MIRLRIERVQSSSLLRRAAGRRDLRDDGFDVEDDTVLVGSEDAAERLLERYPNLSRVDDAPEPEPDDEAQPGSEEPVYTCGVELSRGGECTREVDAPGDRCWQHSD